MRRPGSLPWRVALVAALLLSGCVSFGAPAPGDAPAAGAERDDAASPLPPVAAAPPPDATPRLSASLSFDNVWLRPLQDQAARLDAPGGARARWFVGIEGVHPEVRFVAGRPYVTAEPGKASAHPVATGPIEAGKAAAVRLHEQGRHVFSVDGRAGAALVLSVLSDAPEDASATVFLVQEGAAVRALPERLSVRPGARVVFVNEAEGPHQVARDAFQPWLATGGRALNFTPVDEGMYTLLAEVEDDAGGRGTARARFLVDFDRPASRMDVGPVEGTFWPTGDMPPLFPADASQPFVAAHPVALLQLAANASTFLPGSASVRAQVVRGDEVVADLSTAEGAALEVRDLPPGEYVLRVVREDGVEVRYSASARLTYRLPVPPALRDG